MVCDLDEFEMLPTIESLGAPGGKVTGGRRKRQTNPAASNQTSSTLRLVS